MSMQRYVQYLAHRTARACTQLLPRPNRTMSAVFDMGFDMETLVTGSCDVLFHADAGGMMLSAWQTLRALQTQTS